MFFRYVLIYNIHRNWIGK